MLIMVWSEKNFTSVVGQVGQLKYFFIKITRSFRDRGRGLRSVELKKILQYIDIIFSDSRLYEGGAVDGLDNNNKQKILV